MNLFTTIIDWIKDVINRKPTPKCSSCKTWLYSLTRGKPEMQQLSIAVKCGAAGNVGYVCINCGNKYCQRCMERAGGVLCPICKSPISYLYD